MAILIENQHPKERMPLEKLKRKARAILNALGSPEAELSVLIVDDSRMAELNRQYRGKPTPTNVLAFAMQEGEFAELTPHLLGDVVIAADTAAQEARQSGISLEDRLDALLIHGILHLFGYDHEQGEAEAARTEAKTRELLETIREEG